MTISGVFGRVGDFQPFDEGWVKESTLWPLWKPGDKSMTEEYAKPMIRPIDLKQDVTDQLNRIDLDVETVEPKYDTGKCLAAIPFEDFPLALKAVADISTYGAAKYTRNSWKGVSNKQIRYRDAMMRHFLAHCSGELFDEESKLLHYAHFAWGVLATLQMMLETKVRCDA